MLQYERVGRDESCWFQKNLVVVVVKVKGLDEWRGDNHRNQEK